jgi:sugar phosphate isomerase/epimerase
MPPIARSTDTKVFTMLKSCLTVSLVEEARGGPFLLWDGIPAACKTANQLGFDAIEIFPGDPAEIDAASLRPLLDDHDLKLAAVGTGAGWVKHRLQLADPDPNKRRKAIDFVRGIIDVAGQLGAMAIIGSMQGRHGDGVDRETALNYLADALNVCGQHATQYGVPLIYEPLNRYETNQINTVDQAVEMLEKFGIQNVKLLCDLFHMQIEEADLSKAILRGADHIGHVHFVDSNRRPAGQGHLDFRPVFAALTEIGYDGYLSAEAFPWPDSETAARRTIDAFRYWSGRVQ